ncbi:hypothetical protein AB0K47_05685 [Streptomyces tirandamycinicus]|uniref:Uncharacterized protein n=1 Tax=Streptomyces tirandamycinicus TaxID=2174846 RepID=A0A2S1T0I5_9ACTN|nr:MULTISPECIES: hypothetical protein [Streptomyces]AWI32160.1 hypothetical protein DDW44_27700 [Streptomyces tirandamycinicus]MCY0979884.1 hypothetical protein [Streptomyces tirandamycinicus]NNJ05137.1 hypothetical protein [Streptomyces sp. PKU-MA01144]TFE36205.1 hypothetical protein E3E14_30890 [Streptomyces sp. ICN441]
MKQDNTGEQQPESRQRPAQFFTGSERPFDPEDLVMASGRECTPENVARARKEIAEKGAAALERYLP